MTDAQRIREATDITPDLIEKIHEFVEGRWEIVETATGDRVGNWEDWLDRFESYHPDIDLGDSTDSPAIRKIKRIVRDYLKD